MIDNNYVTIYGPEHEHDNAYICGTKDGLEKLRDSIDEALKRSKFESESMEAFDGEGYGIIIRVMNFNEISNLLPQYTPQYIGDLAEHVPPHALRPWKL